ncbi:MAG: hypothetical protein Q3986_04655 [Akkermansia sp.]|nr:hypothetical protein [Akkermansia sp.]
MKIQAENRAHTPSYPVIAAVAAAAMLALPACGGQTQAPQTLRGAPKPKVESKEAGKEQRSQQPVMGSVVPPAKPERPPQRVCGRKKVAPPKQ